MGGAEVLLLLLPLAFMLACCSCCCCAGMSGGRRCTLGSSICGVMCRHTNMGSSVIMLPPAPDQPLLHAPSPPIRTPIYPYFPTYNPYTCPSTPQVTTAGWPAEEAVRVFIQFERMESATKALVDLQGRFFAGRQLRVAFFDEGRMERSALAPQQGEFD